MMAGWGLISLVLAVAYLGEVLKGQRTMGYFCLFMAVTLLPLFFCFYLYRTDRLTKYFSWILVGGYFVMYTFVLLTGSTNLVFCYILPMLSFMVLFHRSRLILHTGAATLAVNLISIGSRILHGEITIANSKDAEIQLALIVLCFIGAWVSSRLFDTITRENEEYLQQMLKQSEQITSQRDQLEEISEKAFTDALTTIGNRFAFESTLTRLSGTNLGVIFCDINGLKYVNDSEGHAAGDQLLTVFTEQLTSVFLPEYCFRLSGDEFVVIIPEASKSQFSQRAARFHREIWSKKPPIAAIGWCHGFEIAQVLKEAETQMYHDKASFYAKYPTYKR